MSSETGWLIETQWGGLIYYASLSNGGMQGMVVDANEAMRFSRKIDAEKYRAMLLRRAVSENDWRVTEHEWVP